MDKDKIDRMSGMLGRLCCNDPFDFFVLQSGVFGPGHEADIVCHVDEQIGQLYELMRALQREPEDEDDTTSNGKE